MKTIPDAYQDLLKDETKAFAYLATLMKDGSPQVTPIWFDVEEEHILLNTAEGRLKEKNMRNRPQIALCIADPGNPYRYIEIRGKVVGHTQQGAEEHIDKLNLKYHGDPHYPNHNPAQPRVIFKIKPEKVHAQG